MLDEGSHADFFKSDDRVAFGVDLCVVAHGHKHCILYKDLQLDAQFDNCCRGKDVMQLLVMCTCLARCENTLTV